MLYIFYNNYLLLIKLFEQILTLNYNYSNVLLDGSITNRSGKGHRAANSDRGTTPRKERSSKFNRTKSPK